MSKARMERPGCRGAEDTLTKDVVEHHTLASWPLAWETMCCAGSHSAHQCYLTPLLFPLQPTQ